MKIIKAEQAKLENLLETLNIDLFEDKPFVICGLMNGYTNKDGKKVKGIKELWKELNNNRNTLSIEEVEKEKNKIYSLSKQRIGNNFFSYEEAIEKIESEYAKSIGLWIPQGYIVVDADDLETSNKILEYIKEKEIDTPIIKTPHGYQFIFKYDSVESQMVKGTINLGCKVDYRCANKGYIVLPLNTPNREIYNNNGNIEYITHKLLPADEQPKEVIKKSNSKKVTQKTSKKVGRPKKNEVNFEEGSRNNNLYKYLCGYVNNTQLRDYNTMLMFALGVNQFKCNPPLEQEEVETIVKSVIENYAPADFLDEKGKVIPYVMAETIVKDYNCISDKISSYVYNGLSYEEVEIDYYKYIDKYIEDKNLVKMPLVKEITSQIFRQTYKGTIENSREYINFKNGLLNVNTRELIPHNKDVITLGTLNGNYDPSIKSIAGTKFENYLKTSLTDELIPVVQEMLGVCLYPLTDKIHYFYILAGEGRNGKGVLLDIILNMIPTTLRSGITMADYDTRFANATIKGKQINICTDDRTTRLEGIGNLKSVTAGEGIYVERKGVDGEMIQAILTHISAINVLPSLQEKSNALFDRMILIPFEKTFGTLEEVQEGTKDALRDPNLKSYIINNEMDIVINWALDGLFRVIDNGYKFTKTDSIKNKMEEYRDEVDSVRAWIKSEIKPFKAVVNSDYRKDKDLFKWYKEYCEEEDVMAVGKKAFKEGCRRYLKSYYKVIDRYECYSVLREYNGAVTPNTMVACEYEPSDDMPF